MAIHKFEEYGRKTAKSKKRILTFESSKETQPVLYLKSRGWWSTVEQVRAEVKALPLFSGRVEGKALFGKRPVSFFLKLVSVGERTNSSDLDLYGQQRYYSWSSELKTLRGVFGINLGLANDWVGEAAAATVTEPSVRSGEDNGEGEISVTGSRINEFDFDMLYCLNAET